MMNEARQFVVRYPAGYALKFSGRRAEPAPDKEATRFDSAQEAAAAIARAGVSARTVQIETVNAQGERIKL